MILLIAAAIAARSPAAAPRRLPRCRDRRGVRLPGRRGDEQRQAGRSRRWRSSRPPWRPPKAIRRERGCSQPRAICGFRPAQPGKAAFALDRALAGTGLQAEQRGEALLDRARAAEAQNDLKTARAKLNEAAETISEDPFYWYFSAALAIREEDKGAAQSAINKALSLAPTDPTILFEAGHVAHFLGDVVGARDYWTRSLNADPNGPNGKAARDALNMLPAPLDHQELAQIIVDRRHDPHFLERRTAATRAAVVARFAVASADREIALTGGLDLADRSPAVAGELLRADARVAIGLGDHLAA